jgi:integrase
MRVSVLSFPSAARVIPFPGLNKCADKNYRKHGLNRNKESRQINKLPDHWKPYFRFAFSSGLRQGEQIALKPRDIDWSKGFLHVRRAMTLDENGNKVEGMTKNR